MNRRIWTGVVAGALAAAVLLTVGIGAYNAGQDDQAVTRVVTDTDGEVIRVVGDHGWRGGPGPGFFLFPLLLILLVVFVARRAGGWGGGRWRGPWGYGPAGPYGYGPHAHGRYGPEGAEAPGGPCGPGDVGPEATFDEWHRRSHERESVRGSAETAAEAPGSAPPDPEPEPRDAV